MTTPNPFSSGVPAARSPLRLLFYIVPVILVITLVSIIAVSLLNSRPGQSTAAPPQTPTFVSPGVSTAVTPGPVTTSGDVLPTTSSHHPGPANSTVIINTTGQDGSAWLLNITSLDKWARDVNNGDLRTVVRKCWTYPESYIRERYFDQRNRVAAIFVTKPSGWQTGVAWGDNPTEDADRAFITWGEGESDYACPSITFAGENEYPRDLMLHRVHRAILRAQGTPISTYDIDSNYPLICEIPGKANPNIHNLAAADPADISVTASNDDPRSPEWTLRSGPVTMTARIGLGGSCLATSS